MIDTLQSLNFCSSSRAAFQLVMRNLLRVVVLDRLESLKLILISQKIWELKTQRLSELFSPNILLSVTDVLLLLGKLVVVLLCELLMPSVESELDLSASEDIFVFSFTSNDELLVII